MITNEWTEHEHKLVKTFRFNQYLNVIAFANSVMQIAHNQDHHPEMNIRYNAVKVSITDYEKGHVSEKCHRFISEVDKIVTESC